MPECLAHIWILWKDVYLERESGFGVQMLKVRDIMGWANAFQVSLLPFEIECIQAIDREFVGAHDGHSQPESKGKQPRSGAGR